MNHEEEGAQKRVSLPRKETSNFPLPLSPEKNEEERMRYAEGDKKNYSFSGVLAKKQSRSGSQES